MENIGIVVAMDEEKAEIEKLISNKEIKKTNNLKFIIGKIKDKNIVLIQCGVGKVNAARTTQKLIDKFNITTIINVGVAGAINSNLKIGDVIIAKKVIQHDFDITAFGHNKGYITDVGEGIESDKNLLEKAKEMNKDNSYKTKIGIIATGDIFCTDIKMKEKINNKFNADVVDMECGAIAQVSFLENIPFLAIRSVSDIPNGDNAKTFDENLKTASKIASEVLYNIL